MTFEVYDYSNIRYFITFKHEFSGYKKYGDKMDAAPTKRVTVCEIYTGEKSKEILLSTGTSIAPINDFSRLVGRVLSFYRALDNLDLFRNEVTDQEVHTRRFLSKEFFDRNNMAKAISICKDKGFDLKDYLPSLPTSNDIMSGRLSIYTRNYANTNLRAG